MKRRLFIAALLGAAALWIALPQDAVAQFASNVLQVTGLNGAPVQTTVQNQISLVESSTAAIRQPVTCSSGYTPRIVVPTTGLSYVPPRKADGGSMTEIERWNRITITNSNKNQDLVCQRGRTDAGVAPNCTTPGYGDTLRSNGGWVQYDATEAETISCIACTANSALEVTTELCAP